MSVKLLTEHHLEFLSLKGGSTGSSEYTHGKMSHCWKSNDIDRKCFEDWSQSNSDPVGMMFCVFIKSKPMHRLLKICLFV